MQIGRASFLLRGRFNTNPTRERGTLEPAFSCSVPRSRVGLRMPSARCIAKAAPHATYTCACLYARAESISRNVSNATMSESATPKKDLARWYRAAIVGAILLACGVALSPNMVDTDIWGHVRFGQDLLEGKGLPATTEYSFTAEGYPWINHELASEVMLASLAWLGGGVALLVAKLLLGLFVVALMLRVGLRRGVSLTTMAVLMLLVSVNLTYHWATRPQVFSYAMFAMLICILDRAFADWQTQRVCRVRWLWLLPLLTITWTNTHGAFVAGVCITGAYLLGRIVEVTVGNALRGVPSTSENVERRGGRSLQDDRSASRTRLAMTLSLVGVSVLAATLVNPYGFRLPLWLLQSLGEPRPEITEWAAMSPDSVVFWPFVMLVGLTVVALIGSRERRDVTQIVILTICAWQACRHGRHVPFFAIATGFWVGPHLESCLGRIRSSSDKKEASLPTAAWARVAFAVALAGVYVLLASRLYERVHRYPVEKNRYPVAAFQYMADHDLGGRLVVTFNWAQYAIAAFHESRDGVPHTAVAMDGRFRTCYPQQLIDMHFDLFAGDCPAELRYRDAGSGEVEPTRTLEHLDPNLVLLDRKFVYAVSVMQQQDDWVLLYQDGIAQLWGRAAKYDNSALATYLAPNAREISDEAQVGAVDWPALPEARRIRRPSEAVASK